MQHVRAAAIAVLAVIAIGTAAGCGGDDGGAAADPTNPPAKATQPAATEPRSTTPPTVAGPVDACKLLPKAKAEALAGTPLLDGVGAQTDTSSCQYAGPVTGPTAQVEVYIGDGAKKNLDIDRSLEHELTPVADLGDEGYIEDFTVFARKGETWVMIRLVRLEDAPPYNERLIALARELTGEL